MGRKSPPELNGRVDAHDSLGHGSAYWRQVLMSMLVKFTHQLGKKFPREDLHPAGIGHLRGDLDNVKRRSLHVQRDPFDRLRAGGIMEMRMP